MEKVLFVDSEIDIDERIVDLGAISSGGIEFHENNSNKLANLAQEFIFICGHNFIHHDLKYIGQIFEPLYNKIIIDTLYMSPLVFPKRPYHKLLKDDKLYTQEKNNPLHDSIKCRDLFYDEINAFNQFPEELKNIFCSLLFNQEEFQGFFKYIGMYPSVISADVIKNAFKGKICDNSDVEDLIKNSPIELAYVLSNIYCNDIEAVTAPWVTINFPQYDNVYKILRNTICHEGCEYCNSKLNIKTALKNKFGFENFRTYDGEPLQENATQAAVDGKSLLAIFPTGGGKSLTFQLPALIAGEAMHGLTVVISPLNSLTKDQVDNLEGQGIIDAVAISGLLNPVERKEAYERVRSGKASILYIAPELLRSKTIKSLLLARNIVRFVIDEAHCFSAWGHDFRVDYLFLGRYIKELQEEKGYSIPVSCFTATAKQKVIADIRGYFQEHLGINLEIYATTSTRKNLRYTVLYKNSEAEKYQTLRNLIIDKNCPTIVYVSRTKKTEEIAQKLRADGFSALAYHGRLDALDKIDNQEAFIRNEVQVIVATSAFGMGVDKKDVGLVVHYEISDSLENYIQEAGRAGRDESKKADCYVLYNESDLNAHFALLKESKLSINEIRAVWSKIKAMSGGRKKFVVSPYEIAHEIGWNENRDYDTKVKAAISALELSGYVKRGMNVPRVYASSINVDNMTIASKMIEDSDIFSQDDKQLARRIMSYIFTQANTSAAYRQGESIDARVDSLSIELAVPAEDIIRCVNKLRQIKVLELDKDMEVFIRKNNTENGLMQKLERIIKLERFLLEQIPDTGNSFNLKELNNKALQEVSARATINDIRNIINFWKIQDYMEKTEYNSQNRNDLIPMLSIDKLIIKHEKRWELCRFIIEYLYKFVKPDKNCIIRFSEVGLFNEYKKVPKFETFDTPITMDDIYEAMLFLVRTRILNLNGGLLVIHSNIEIERLITDNKIKYKNEDYKEFDEYYKNKIQQIHIVGEYANMMVRDYSAALEFVNDYFNEDYKKFINKYFKGNRLDEIKITLTPNEYEKLFGGLSKKQLEIINDKDSKCIVVAAGPGSGKTKVLVHKLASLLLLEDIKSEQLLMLTFSRAAATEFKKRLYDLIGKAASFVDIKTFHSYCFDLIGKIGDLQEADNIVRDATEMINSNEVEMDKISKSVLVIDEAQDMDQNEFNLVKALMDKNEDLRVIAVGDDAPNISEFRGSNSKYLKELINEEAAVKYEMVDNYRSCDEIVSISNIFVKTINQRMKDNDGRAVNTDKGIVKLIKHVSPNMEEPIVEDIKNRSNRQSCCVLTSTNEEALRIVGLLNKNGISAKLMQSMDGFLLSNILEIRYFLDYIDKNTSSPLISDSIWENAKEKLYNKYKESETYDICKNIINDFEQLNEKKYRSDLQEFINESKYEDFCTINDGIVFVSTIHKSKGKEFDCVYILAKNEKLNNDEERRKIFVGMTRAKKELYIHYNNNVFDWLANYGIEKAIDYNQYSIPEEIVMQLSHRDIVLSFTESRKTILSNLKSGDSLQPNGYCLMTNMLDKPVAVVKYSKAFMEKLELVKSKGYEIIDAKVRFVLNWIDKETNIENLIVLPDIKLKFNPELLNKENINNKNIIEEPKENPMDKYRIIKEPIHQSHNTSANKYKFTKNELSLSEIAREYNEANNLDKNHKVSYKKISEWLVKKGLLENKECNNGKTKKWPTKLGFKSGISIEERTREGFSYCVILYDKEAQKYIIDNINEINRL